MRALMLFLLLSVPVGQLYAIDGNDKINNANQLYSQGKFSQAFVNFLPLAEEGDPDAQDMVGMMYMLGVGTDKNFALGALWLSLAAQQGVDHAAETREKLIAEYRQEILDDLKTMH